MIGNWTFIATLPGQKEYTLFEEVIKNIYSEGSPRFVLGHEPSSEYLVVCYILLLDDKPIGRYAFYDNPSLINNGQKLACIGSYECMNSEEASRILLEHAIQEANKQSYEELIGPMEGSTWQSYRFSEHNDQPNFFMEPYHHAYYNQQFLNAGFRPIARYFSNLDKQLNFDENELAAMETSYLRDGATIRKLDIHRLSEDLTAIAKLSIDGFSQNFLYSPISIDDFVNKYEGFSSYFDPELVWIIEDKDQRINAFIFAIKDFFDPSNKTVIIKSMVRLKDSPFKAVGKFLSAKINLIAKQKGYGKVIHALMIEDNASRKISEKMDIEHFKSYVLYAKNIENDNHKSTML